MIKNTINSFANNINQKLKNPFLGTFIIVWIIRNWEFIYSLFYFDSKLPLDNRIIKIKVHFINYNIVEILITIGLTFLILIATYILLNLSRLIVNFFDKMITPKVYEITDRSSVVLKAVHDESNKKIDKLESRVQSERELRLKTQNENEQLENRIKELVSSGNNLKTNVSDSKDSKKINKAELILKKLKAEEKVDLFKKIASEIINGNFMAKTDEPIREFARMGLIERGSQHNGIYYFYKFTPMGNSIHEDLLLDELK